MENHGKLLKVLEHPTFRNGPSRNPAPEIGDQVRRLQQVTAKK